MIHVHEVIQGTDEWHALRAGKYTGSNAHKLLKYGAREFTLTQTTAFGGNFYTRRGHTLEEQAVDLYERIFKSSVERPGFVTNDTLPTCGYSPDGLTERLVIEVKCFNKTKHLKIFGGEIPVEILAQIHFGMMICDRSAAQLVIYNPDFMKPEDGSEPQPKLAFKSIDIKMSRTIRDNFKNIIKKGASDAAFHTT